MDCYEYVGRATATQARRQCAREAINLVHFQGEWRPVCQYHRAMYSDLPMRKVEKAASR